MSICNKFLCIFLLAASLLFGQEKSTENDRIHLALRRIGDKVLRSVGDDTSRVGTIREFKGVWQIHLQSKIDYAVLPKIVGESFSLYGIDKEYTTTLRNCNTDGIEVGYHYLDFLRDTIVPCGGRALPNDCYYIEISFGNYQTKRLNWIALGIVSFFIIGLLYFKKSSINETLSVSLEREDDSFQIGNYIFSLQAQRLTGEGANYELTYREAKLLHLFAVNIGVLLERDYILQQVWADEGIQVGRSIDVFVSRLRKKFAQSDQIQIIAVHGVGYKMIIK